MLDEAANAARTAPIERIGPMDLTVLATDRGSVPMNIGALLEFDELDRPSLAEVRTLLAQRLPAIPRLRQRLHRPPLGCGRPVWVDDAGFDLDRHLTAREWPSPFDRRQLLDVAADLVCDRLDRSRPLWRACLVADPAGKRAALVLVFHHVLADGLSGLAVLATLAWAMTPACGRSQFPPVADDHARLAAIVTLTRPNATLQRASSAGPLGLAFRALSRLGMFRLFVERQRLVHTFETNLRGPAEPVFLGGHLVRTIVPAAVNPGNIGVSFDVLSYAGVLGVTVVTDPDIVTEPDGLVGELARVLASLLRT